MLIELFFCVSPCSTRWRIPWFLTTRERERERVEWIIKGDYIMSIEHEPNQEGIKSEIESIIKSAALGSKSEEVYVKPLLVENQDLAKKVESGYTSEAAAILKERDDIAVVEKAETMARVLENNAELVTKRELELQPQGGSMVNIAFQKAEDYQNQAKRLRELAEILKSTKI